LLFQKKEFRFCINCAHAAELDEDTMLCKVKGTTQKASSCARFCYDPLKREPPRPRSAELLTGTDADFSL